MTPKPEETSSNAAMIIEEKTPSFRSESESTPEADADAYPFTWTDLSDEEKKERKKIYTAEGPWCVSPKASMLVSEFAAKCPVDNLIKFYDSN